MEQEMFNITSQKYTDYLREMLLDMKNSSFLSDVTLVCEDKKQYKAHKFILSSSSPFFKDIIDDNLLANPIIYLRGIHSYEMELILEFIYLGQATCKEDRVKEFLDVATLLEIKQISKSKEKVDKGKDINVPDLQYIEEKDLDPSTCLEIKQKIKNEVDVDKGKDIKVTDLQYIEENILDAATSLEIKQKSNNEEKTDKDVKDLQHKEKKLKPPLRDTSEYEHKKIKTANESRQVNRFQCDKCEKQYTHISNLKQHVRSDHEGFRYFCDECNHEATQLGHLRRHKKRFHEGVKSLNL